MQGAWNPIYPLPRDLQEGREATVQEQILGIRDMQEVKWGWERRKLTGRWPRWLHQLGLQELQSAEAFSKTSRQRARLLLSSLTVFLACLCPLWPKKLSRQEGSHTDLVPAWWPDPTPTPFLLWLQGQCIWYRSSFWNACSSSSLWEKQAKKEQQPGGTHTALEVTGQTSIPQCICVSSHSVGNVKIKNSLHISTRLYIYIARCITFV